MFRKKSMLTLAALVLPLVVANAAEKKTATANKTVAYSVDKTASSIKWVGKKVTGQHNGTISITDGDVRVSNGKIVGGNIVIDPNSIVVEDLQGDSKEKLTGHLKSDDFFGVEKNPTATFEITKVEESAATEDATHTVTGNLTIKGASHPLTFPALVNVTNNIVTADAKNVAVDRTLYGMKYGSGKFFQGLGDKMINDQFWLDIHFVAKK